MAIVSLKIVINDWDEIIIYWFYYYFNNFKYYFKTRTRKEEESHHFSFHRYILTSIFCDFHTQTEFPLPPSECTKRTVWWDVWWWCWCDVMWWVMISMRYVVGYWCDGMILRWCDEWWWCWCDDRILRWCDVIFMGIWWDEWMNEWDEIKMRLMWWMTWKWWNTDIVWCDDGIMREVRGRKKERKGITREKERKIRKSSLFVWYYFSH